jgi:hypothetical protein
MISALKGRNSIAWRIAPGIPRALELVALKGRHKSKPIYANRKYYALSGLQVGFLVSFFPARWTGLLNFALSGQENLLFYFCTVIRKF